MAYKGPLIFNDKHKHIRLTTGGHTMADFDQELDASGLNCPLPILRAKKTLNGMESGKV
jgi:hypothetical protein